MSEASAGIVGILTILGIILGGLCCLAIPVVVVVIIVVANKKKKAKDAADQPIEVKAEYPDDPQQ